jgi:hypothetical protein
MTNAKIKTVPTSADVLEFLARLDDDQQRQDSETIIEMIQDITGKQPVMWGPAIIGFGSYHYKYDSGREGDMPDLAFSPRKGKIAFYITDSATNYPEIRERLGKHTTAKMCVYIKRLSDIDVNVLDELFKACYRDIKKEVQ